MRLDSSLLCLPASIIILIVSRCAIAEPLQGERAPIQWPAHIRYWPEDPPTRRRDLEAYDEHIKLGRSPVGVMKMSPDPGEKFYMEYWQFQAEVSGLRQRSRKEKDEAILLMNVSETMGYRAPFALHTEDEQHSGLRERSADASRDAASVLATLEGRAFTCPTDTASCADIGYPNSCCASGETCYEITDTGLGSVGCCPNGKNCGGSIGECNAPNSGCPQNLGGGCCIPNYVCAGFGCIINPALVTTVIITRTLTVTAASTSSTSIQTTTSVSTITPSSSSDTYTGLQTTLACRSDSNPCPVNLGGGCCNTDRVCAGSMMCALPPGSQSSSTTTTISASTSSGSVTGGIPIRPTSDSASSTGEITQTGTECPVYFYACSARYGGGCCQTGRNCDVTSCPPTSSTTIISSGKTVFVPVGSAATVTTPTGICASGWATCAASIGGNCCPSGWQCGTASCSSVGPSETAVEQKQSPNSGGRNSEGTGALLLAGALMLIMTIM